MCLQLFCLVLIAATFGYELECPASSEWRLRARAKNCTGKYVCLLHLPEYYYIEDCNGPDVSNKGTKLVFQPYFNNAKCRNNRYQPFKFSTDGTSRCVYQKSFCNEEGQFVYQNGSVRNDTTCGCNSSKGYYFVTKPSNACYCIPSEEDCSCYKPSCKRRDNNYQCLQDDDVLMNTLCSEIKTEMSQESNMFALLSGELNDTKHITDQDFQSVLGGKYRLHCSISTTVLVVFMIIIVVLVYCTCNREGKMESEKEDVSPDICSNEIEKWKHKKQTFVFTRAFNEVLNRILSSPCVAVTGVGGCGKSSIVCNVAIKLEKEHNYVITIIKNAAELKSNYKPGIKTVFVLDDVWGKFTANKCLIENWNSVLPIVNKVISDNSCRILFSCRLQVFKDKKLSTTVFKQYECNIISDELYLTKQEKKDMFKIYMNDDLTQIDVLHGQIFLFPLLCELYSKEQTHSSVHHYFTTPYDIYSKELATLRSHDRYKLCGLALCVIFNNKLKISDFEEMKNNFSHIIDSICQHLQLNIEKSKYRRKIKNALDTLDGTYVKVMSHENHYFYETLHDKLFDILAYYFGQTMIKCLIEHGDSEFIRERFICLKSIDMHETETEFIIDLDKKFLPSYIRRLIFDWSESKISDVFYNINMKNPDFRKEFIKFLNNPEHTKEQKERLANMHDPFRKDYASGNTPLIISSVEGYIDLLKWLIHYDADVNYKRKDGVSALYMASQKDDFEIVKILLDKSANVNDDTIEGVTPLGTACYNSGNIRIVRELLNCNADVNKYKYLDNNMTPLFMACLKDYVQIVEILLQNKADPNICLYDGYSPLLFSCIKGQTDVVRLLLESDADFNYELSGGYTPLFFAASFGFLAIVELLLKKGSDQTKHVAKKEKIEKELNSFPTTPNDTSCDYRGKTWSWFDHIVTKCSSKVKAYVNTKPKDYFMNVLAESTPLHAACFMGYSEITKLLIREISNVDIQKSDGTTPLFYACELGHTDIVIALIEKGADPKICRADQISPIQIAKDNGHNKLLQLMEKE